MKIRYSIARLFIAGLYLFVVAAGLFFNTELLSINAANKNSSDDSQKKIATLVDSKGHFIVYEKPKYEAWLDIEFMKRQKKYAALITKLQTRFLYSEIENKKYICWGTYETLELAKKDLGELYKFANIHRSAERVYNNLFSLNLMIGKYDQTTYGIEKYLYNKGMLSGKDRVTVTLDMVLQKIAYEEIKRVKDALSAEGAIAIVMETANGKIRASAAVYPWNLGFMGYIEPGSTFKPLIYALAIDEKISNPYESILCERTYQPVQDVSYKMKEAENEDFGLIDIKEALSKSSNIAVAKTMKKIMNVFDENWLYQKLLNMGLGEKTGVEFEGEISGALAQPDKWYKIMPFQIAIGQGIGVTPIQLVSAFNILVNSGNYVKPTFVEETEIIPKRVFTQETSKLLVDWMKYTTLTGTARLAYKEGIAIGGKTGTAQKALAEVGYASEKYYALFAGFYPVTDPKYTIVVIIDDPKGEKYYGGEVAAPIATNIFYRYFKETDAGHESAGSLFREVIPDLTGQDVQEAVYILNALGIPSDKIIISGSGKKVISQEPSQALFISDIQFIQLFVGE